MEKEILQIFKMQSWVGVKIPQLGYLDPNPLSLSDDLTISLGFVK